MKRRFAALALCAVLCALSFAPASAAVAPVNVRDDSIVRSRSTVVYCLSEDRYRLVPEVRPVSAETRSSLSLSCKTSSTSTSSRVSFPSSVTLRTSGTRR